MKMIIEPISVGLFSGWDKIVTVPGIESLYVIYNTLIC